MTNNPNISIHQLSSTPGRERWDEFVRNCADASFFHLSGWQPLIEDVLGHQTWYLYAEQKNRIIAVLPLAEIRSRLFGHFIASLPFCAYGGAVGDKVGTGLLEARAEEIALGVNAEHMEFRNRRRRHLDWPTQDLYATFRKPISPDENDNFLAIPRKQRAMVRRAINNGLRSQVDGDVDRFFSLYSNNVSRHGTPALPKHYFVEVRRRFGGACDVLTVIDQRGRALSSVLSFYFRDEVLPYYAGDIAAARTLAANDFKYWELMRRACSRGMRLFDYGRSKAGTGPWNFKKNWGFEPEPLAYEYRLYRRDSIPQNNPLNPRYSTLIALWRLLPVRLANRFGPSIARQLG